MRHLFRLFRASAGDRGDVSARPALRRALRAHRGNVEPGQSGRRLYRHEAGGLPRLSSITIAERVGLPRDRILLGGDHLGPNAWQALPAEEAMARAEVMIADYVCAGFRKIHLDCSMSCADDPVPLSDETVARRAARLCAVAERAICVWNMRAREESCRSMSLAPRSRLPAALRKSWASLRSRRPMRRVGRSTCIARSSPKPASPTLGRA